ncbi:hypothetical protein HUJ05_007708 [Dendroctonus ponderosae]|nr:hypothetical protein HUJ05_007708 [Dendroctonus ponderosae]
MRFANLFWITKVLCLRIEKYHMLAAEKYEHCPVEAAQFRTFEVATVTCIFRRLKTTLGVI